MTKNHLKRLNTPKTWKILRKEEKFVTRPNSGAHKQELGMSINTFFKTVLKRTITTKDTKTCINKP